MPLVLANPIPKPAFDLIRIPGPHRGSPDGQTAFHVVGVKHRDPAKIAAFAFRNPGELIPTPVIVIELSVRTRGPNDLRHGIGQLSEAGFALLEIAFVFLSL